MKTILITALLLIAGVCTAQAQTLDTIKELSNQNVLTLIDAKTKDIH